MTTPKKYRISALLINGAQPFKNLDPETREYLTATIKAHGNLRRMPVLLSADGILYDGHQRLMILADLGRKEINLGEFIINPKVVGRERAYEEAMKANFNRRHLSGEDKAHAMWELRREFKFSQTTIAKMLGMRQPSVSQLMNKYRPADADDMTTTVGEDGRVTTNPSRRSPAPTHPPGEPRPPAARPFEIDGKASLALRNARSALANNTPVNLTSWEAKTLRDILRALAKDCENFIDEYLPE